MEHLSGSEAPRMGQNDDPPMEQAQCSSAKCKLCFRERPDQAPEEDHLPSYMRSTTASRSRRSLALQDAVAFAAVGFKTSSPSQPAQRRLSYRPRSNPQPPGRRQRSFHTSTLSRKPAKKVPMSILLRFPPEIRSRIYDYMILDPSDLKNADRKSNESDGVLIWGSVIGGAHHFEKPSTGTWLNASKSFASEILTINKQIYAEALNHIYKRIPVDFYVKNKGQSQRLTYWLRVHPLRLTRELTLYFSLDLDSAMPGLTAYNRPQGQDDALWDFAAHCRSLPNLQKFIIQLIPAGTTLLYGLPDGRSMAIKYAAVSDEDMRKMLRPLEWFKPDFAGSRESPANAVIQKMDEGSSPNACIDSVVAGEADANSRGLLKGSAEADVKKAAVESGNSGIPEGVGAEWASYHTPDLPAATEASTQAVSTSHDTTQQPQEPAVDLPTDASNPSNTPEPADDGTTAFQHKATPQPPSPTTPQTEPTQLPSPTSPFPPPNPPPPATLTIEILLSTRFQYDRREYNWQPPAGMVPALDAVGLRSKRVYVTDQTKYFGVQGALWELNPRPGA